MAIRFSPLLVHRFLMLLLHKGNSFDHLVRFKIKSWQLIESESVKCPAGW